MKNDWEELKAVVSWISEQTSRLSEPMGRRARIASECLDLSIQHQAGIVLLAAQPLWGPTYALLGCTFDAFIRGIWLARCATESDLDLFELAGLRTKVFADLVEDVERALGHTRGVLSKLQKSSWAMFSDISLIGSEQGRRRASPAATEQDYPDSETSQALRLATALGLLAATERANLCGHRTIALACKARTLSFAAGS